MSANAAKTANRTRPRVTLACSAMILAAATGLTGSAHAQFGEAAGFGEMMSPYFLRRDLALFAEGLQLDEGQEVILENLHYDYEDEHEAGKTLMLDRLSKLRTELEGLDRTEILSMVFKPFEDRSREWDSMRYMFLENLKAILSSEQLRTFDTFMMELRREKELPKGRFSGESVNLFHMVDELDLDETTMGVIELTLEEYAARLERALVWREGELQDSRLAMMHAIRNEDPESSLAIYARQIQARIAIRDANDTYREALAGALPFEVAGEFRHLVLTRAYPRVFRPTAAERLFIQAKKIEALEVDILDAIIALEVQMIAEIDHINLTLMDLVREFEPEEAAYRASAFAKRAVGERAERPADPTRAEFRRRDKRGVYYVELLREFLTPEQFASLSGAQRFLRKKNAAVAVDRNVGSLNDERKKKSLEQSAEGFGATLKGSGGGDD